jgi:hypothetical protein
MASRAKLKWCMANRNSKEPVLQLLHFSQWRNTSKDLFASLWTWSPPFMDCDWIITSNLELQQFSTCDVEEHIRWAYDGRKHGDYDPEQQERQDQRMDDPSANLDSATWSDRPWEEATATADLTEATEATEATADLPAMVDMEDMDMGIVHIITTDTGNTLISLRMQFWVAQFKVFLSCLMNSYGYGRCDEVE